MRGGTLCAAQVILGSKTVKLLGLLTNGETKSLAVQMILDLKN